MLKLEEREYFQEQKRKNELSQETEQFNIENF